MIALDIQDAFARARGDTALLGTGADFERSELLG